MLLLSAAIGCSLCAWGWVLIRGWRGVSGERPAGDVVTTAAVPDSGSLLRTDTDWQREDFQSGVRQAAQDDLSSAVRSEQLLFAVGSAFFLPTLLALATATWLTAPPGADLLRLLPWRALVEFVGLISVCGVLTLIGCSPRNLAAVYDLNSPSACVDRWARFLFGTSADRDRSDCCGLPGAENGTDRIAGGLQTARGRPWFAMQDLGAGVWACLLCIAPVYAINSLIDTLGWREAGQIHPQLLLLVQNRDQWLWCLIWIALTAAACTPILEELQYRVLLTAWLRQRWSVAVSLVTVAVLFAVVHWSPGRPDAWPLLPLALILGLLYHSRRSLLANSVCHALFNLLNLLLVLGDTATR